MWMPTASDEAVEFPVPMHPNLEVVSVSVQSFNNCALFSNLRRTHAPGTDLNIIVGARRLMTYRRLPDGEVSDISKGRSKVDERGIYADELNSFRRKVCNM